MYSRKVKSQKVLPFNYLEYCLKFLNFFSYISLLFLILLIYFSITSVDILNFISIDYINIERIYIRIKLLKKKQYIFSLTRRRMSLLSIGKRSRKKKKNSEKGLKKYFDWSAR